jgi:hypothetical protein
MPGTEDYKSESLYRNVQVSRYIQGQANYIKSLIGAMNEKISHYLTLKERLETKKSYNDCRVHIRKKCLACRRMVYAYLQRELKRFVKEQAKWVYGNSPVTLQKANTGKIYTDVFFTPFSDTDTVKSYCTRIFNQVYQLWAGQLGIAYKTGNPLKETVKAVLG